MTSDNPRLHGKPEVFPGVGSSDLVRHVLVNSHKCPSKANDTTTSQTIPPSIQETLAGTNLAQIIEPKTMEAPKAVNNAQRVNALAASKNLIRNDSAASPPRIGMRKKYAAKYLYSAGVAFRSRSPAVKRARKSMSHDIIAIPPNAKVSDGSQPPMTLNLSLSETAGSRSLHRLVRSSVPSVPSAKMLAGRHLNSPTPE